MASLPSYEIQQLKLTLKNQSYQFSLAALPSFTLTATNLLVEDLALIWGCSPAKAKWWFNSFSYSMQGLQLAYDHYYSEDALINCLPLFASQLAYTVCTKIAPETANSASTVAFYTTRSFTKGLIPTIGSFFASAAGSFLGSSLENKAIEAVVTPKLVPHFLSRLQNLKDRCDSLIEGNISIINFKQKMFEFNQLCENSKPTFNHYRQLCALEQELIELERNCISVQCNI
jgi:hypothetical protein